MKKRILCAVLSLALFLCLLPGIVIKAAPTEEIKKKIEEPENLYAQSAVLIDADSGRILFAKNGQEERPMASTTKIMTCILALELGNMEEKAAASAQAAAQPEVKLGVKEGQEFYLEDLLYSLMLESHNDTAVVIAEHISGSTEKFAEKMNEKAEELGCSHTYFITPNGLDAQDEIGIHHTTAEDLAIIMKYCIMDSPKAEEFLAITQTKEYQFSDCSGNGNYHCSNHNAFLNMMDGALSGKTGFTADAGYCYVGALSDGERTFIVALLACGWPNNKGYKWSDTRKLMTYGLENYQYRDVWKEIEESKVVVENGVTEDSFPGEKLEIETRVKGKSCMLLLREDEQVEVTCEMPDKLKAPVQKGYVVGKVIYTLGNEKVAEYEIVTDETIAERSFSWSCSFIFQNYFLNEDREIKINQ